MRRESNAGWTQRRNRARKREKPYETIDMPPGIRHCSGPAARRRRKNTGIPKIVMFRGEHKMAKKKAKAGKKRKPNAAFMKPMNPSAALGAVIGSSAMPRTEVTKKIWQYIKRHNLQDKKNRRNINADDKLKPVFCGKSQVSMFEMTKLVNKHLK